MPAHQKTWHQLLERLHQLDQRGRVTRGERLELETLFEVAQESLEQDRTGWSEAFGELRSILSKPEFSTLDRIKFQLLTSFARSKDARRYTNHWTPYIEQHHVASLLLESISLEREFEARRASGVVCVHLSKRSHEDPRQSADVLLDEYGFKAMGTQAWQELPAARAKSSLHKVMRYDMAYEGEVMEPEDAEELVQRFLAHFTQEQLTWLTGPWNVLPQATFSQTLACMDEQMAAFLIFWDED